jgi:hypothetical protein
LYTACSSLLPEPMLKMTGEAYAMQLLRREWTNSSRSGANHELHEMLDSVLKYCKYLPALSLLVKYTRNSMKTMEFLHVSKETAPVGGFVDSLDENQYLNDLKNPERCKNHDVLLTEHEELVIFGGLKSFPRDKRGIQKQYGLKDSTDVFSKNISELVKSCPKNPVEFPLQMDDEKLKTKIGENILHDLKDAWDANENLPILELGNDVQALKIVNDNLVLVQYIRSQLERQCLASFSPHFSDEMILAASNFYSFVKPVDLVVLAANASARTEWGLSESYQHITDLILKWMDFCVLEDRLNRVLKMLKSSDIEKAITEMSQKREWKIEEHPWWLAFEVEGCLQIRSEQYHLM